METKRPLLQDKVRDPALIRSFVPGGKETERLDFKREIGKGKDGTPKIPELAKDIAALANNMGGELIIGVVEDEDTGEAIDWKWIPDSDVKTHRQWITDSFVFLRPGDLATSVVFDPVHVNPDQNVIVISVPAYPDLVAVQVNSSRLDFPLRVETHTSFLAYEEIMQRSRATARAMYLTIFDLLRRISPEPFVRLCSPVKVVSGVDEVSLPVHEARQAWLKALGPDTMDLRMGAVNVQGTYWDRAHNNVAVMPITIPDDQPLKLPYGLIREAWAEESYLALALDGASVVWNGMAWRVIVG